MSIALIDESGFMLQGVRARTWAPRGQTPIQRVAGPRKHISVISAITVSPIKRRLGLYFETYEHSINGKDVLPFMRLLRRSLGRGVIFVLDLLNAHRWAAREYRRRAASVEFEWLPPYAPDLTPVEQVWNHGKNVELANFIPGDLKDLDRGIRQALRRQRCDSNLLYSFFRYAKLKLRRFISLPKYQ